MALLDLIKKNPETQTNKKDKFYKVGERVELIIYERTIPNKSLERLIDLKSLHGDDYEYPIKESGIAYKCAIIRRNLDENYEGGEYLFKDINKLPSIPIVTKIEFMPPEDIKFDKFAFLYRKGIGYSVYNNVPELIYLFPGILNDNTDNKYKESINKEWNQLIEEYENANEEEVIQYLEDRLSRRYGICRITDNDTIEVIKPKIGVTFTSTITNTNYPFFTINSIIYNKNTKKTEVKTGLNAQYNKATIKLAETIKQLIEANKNKKNNKNNDINNIEDILEDMF